jgi:hypothetical protein
MRGLEEPTKKSPLARAKGIIANFWVVRNRPSIGHRRPRAASLYFEVWHGVLRSVKIEMKAEIGGIGVAPSAL